MNCFDLFELLRRPLRYTINIAMNSRVSTCPSTTAQYYPSRVPLPCWEHGRPRGPLVRRVRRGGKKREKKEGVPDLTKSHAASRFLSLVSWPLTYTPSHAQASAALSRMVSSDTSYLWALERVRHEVSIVMLTLTNTCIGCWPPFW